MVDFGQARPPQWRPHRWHTGAAATALPVLPLVAALVTYWFASYFLIQSILSE